MGREESYAIHALIYASENPGAGAARIAKDLEMPAAFMAKVLGKLAQAGLIENRMGRHGGVFPLPETPNATLLQVIEVISGPFLMDTCQAQAQCITTRRKGWCQLNVAYHHAGNEIRRALDGVRVGELADLPPAEDPRPAP